MDSQRSISARFFPDHRLISRLWCTHVSPRFGGDPCGRLETGHRAGVDLCLGFANDHVEPRASDLDFYGWRFGGSEKMTTYTEGRAQ